MNDNVIPRPNSAAVFTALGVYLDVMRPFVVRNMPVYPGTANACALLRDSLPIEMQGDFDKQLDKHSGDESLTIEVTHIPHIVKRNWDLSFARKFDRNRAYITRMEGLAKYRNMVSHPSAADVSLGQAESVFHCVEKITTQIERDDASEQVSLIRQRLKDGCCSDCPESHMRIETDGQKEVELEMRRMQSELVALSQELSAIRGQPRRPRRSVLASRLARIVPRVSFRFSVSLGDAQRQAPKESTDTVKLDESELTVVPSSSNGHVGADLNEQRTSDNGDCDKKVRRGMFRSNRARKR